MMPPGCAVVGYPPEGAIIGKKQTLPDYLNDLNAMHEAEKRLNGQQQINYCNELDNVVFKGGLIPTMATRMHVVHASATQRADALLETMNLCKESAYATS